MTGPTSPPSEACTGCGHPAHRAACLQTGRFGTCFCPPRSAPPSEPVDPTVALAWITNAFADALPFLPEAFRQGDYATALDMARRTLAQNAPSGQSS